MTAGSSDRGSAYPDRSPTALEARVAPIRRALSYSGLLLLLIFGLYELVERTWLTHVRPEELQMLHMVRGIVSSMLVGVIVAWSIVKSSPPILAASSPQADCADRARLTEGERTRIYAQWFISMRWLAVLVAAVLIFINVKLANLLPAAAWPPLLVTLGLLALCNMAYTRLMHWEAGGRAILLLQGYIDLFILTLLLHFSGGVENPLSTVMIFHVIIGGILLSRRHCYGLATVGSLLFAALVWAEYAEVWDHYTLKVFPHFQMPGGEIFHAAHQPLYALSRIPLQAAILFLTAYFVTTLTERLRYNEQRLEAMAHRALADRQLLERALETTGAGLRLFRPDHDACWSSKLWSEWFDCRPGEACQGCALLSRDDSPMRQCLADGQTRVTELVLAPRNCPSNLLRQTSSERVFQITTAALLDGNDQVAQVVELAQDITAQKQAQAQMVRAGKLAAVGELAGQVAHEVNNPIAIITAKASLLLADHREGMSSKVTKEVEKMRELATRVARIAQGLLSYCRPSPGTRTRLDLRVPIRRSLGLIEEHARRNGVRIEDRLPEPMPAIHANPHELEQVFLNLFLNALDAMPKGGFLRVRAPIEPAPLADGRPTVAIVVEDTGCGIAPEIRERVFEPFFTTKQEGRGTGLGLSVCLGLIRSHQGEIELESKPAQGTRITIRLPVHTAPAPVEEAVHA